MCRPPSAPSSAALSSSAAICGYMQPTARWPIPGQHFAGALAAPASPSAMPRATPPNRRACQVAQKNRDRDPPGHPGMQRLAGYSIIACSVELHDRPAPDERAIAQVASWRGRRLKLRYSGLTRNHAWLKRRTATVNLRVLLSRGLARRDGAWGPGHLTRLPGILAWTVGRPQVAAVGLPAGLTSGCAGTRRSAAGRKESWDCRSGRRGSRSPGGSSRRGPRRRARPSRYAGAGSAPG